MSKRASWFWILALIFGLSTGVFTLWIWLHIGGPRTTDAVDDIGEFLAAIVAAGACGRAAYRLKHARAGWALLSASSFAWAAGEGVWTYYDLGQGITVPFPSLADVGFLAAVPLALAGLLLLPGAARSGTSRLRGLLDGLVIGGSLFFVSWATVLGPIYQQHQGGVLAQSVSVAYPLSDIVIASLVVILATRHGTRNRASLALVMVGMLAFALSDSSFSYLTTVKSYGIGNVLDSGWVIGYLLIALGASWAANHSVEAVGEKDRVTRWMVLGPYIPAALAGIVYLWRLWAHEPLRGVTGVTAFGIVLAMSVRQVLVLFDNLDLTQRLEVRVRERTAQLRHQALHDDLTGLGNRTLLLDRLEHALRQSERRLDPVAVLFLDLDDFKTVNDSLGHPAGDRLLVAVAQRLTSITRSGDTLARLGGDEFALLLESGAMPKTAQEIATRIGDALDAPFFVDGKEMTTRASIGIAVDPQTGETAGDLLRDADLAMYLAKQNGKGRFEMVRPGMQDDVLKRFATTTDLRHALDVGELEVFYQAIVRVHDKRPAGVEALVRWHHPSRGLVSPVEFIGIAEATGLIVPLGDWVLNEACRQAQSWRLAGVVDDNFYVSVNLSPRQLAESTLVENVARALRSSGLPPESLILEITESALMLNFDTGLCRLQALKDLGIKIGLDDYGTGYSSLNRLGKLPIDIVKIDKSFIDQLTVTPEGYAVVRSVLDVTHALGLSAVAEGVEQAGQFTALAELACDCIQGYLFTKPMPAVGIESALRDLSPTDHFCTRTPRRSNTMTPAI